MLRLANLIGPAAYLKLYCGVPVMGIKGRRVHMIEELSDTIISFQRGMNARCRDCDALAHGVATSFFLHILYRNFPSQVSFTVTKNIHDSFFNNYQKYTN